jgi:hypothetical protein
MAAKLVFNHQQPEKKPIVDGHLFGTDKGAYNQINNRGEVPRAIKEKAEVTSANDCS